jgi:hypothetical protein
VSGELEARQGGVLQHGPHGAERPESPFSSRQLARLDEALTLSSRECGLTFSVYVGELEQPSRAHAERLFERLTPSAVLLAVSPGQRLMHIVTGEKSADRLPNRACALAALTMRASFSNGDLTGGIVNGLRMLADLTAGLFLHH